MSLAPHIPKKWAESQKQSGESIMTVLEARKFLHWPEYDYLDDNTVEEIIGVIAELAHFTFNNFIETYEK